MADCIREIAKALNSNTDYAESSVEDVRTRTKREISDQQILEAIKVVNRFPFPWKEYHATDVKWVAADIVEAVTRYLRNPAGYRAEVKARHRERVANRQPFFVKQRSKKKKAKRKQNESRTAQKKSGRKQDKQKGKVPREVFALLPKQANELAKNQEWAEVAKVCRWWIELSPRSMSARYRLACALFNLGQLDEAEELCKTIRSSFRLNRGDADIVKNLLQEISAKRTSALESEFQELAIPNDQPVESQLNDVWDNQISNQLLVPDPSRRETWITQHQLNDKVQAFLERDRTLDMPKLGQFSRQCWAEIRLRRRYQVPSQGRAEILASDTLSDLMDLRLVRFVQEGASAPEVFVRFGFGEPCTIGIARIKDNGSTEGFHMSAGSDLFGAIIEATALAYYRDLVVPTKVYHSRTESDTPQVRAPVSSRTTKTPPPPPQRASESQHQTYRLPRTQVASSKHQTYRLDQWYQAQERARHGVVGHIRWIGQHFRADSLKVRQAREAGVELQPGYTWVIEHERGGRRSDGLRLSGLDLAERTRFLPPEKASIELDRLLS
jgi:hypothetical protein